MIVKWTYHRPLHTIPEEYWGEDLSLFDQDHSGEVIGTTRNFWGDVFLTVACDDGKIRDCKSDLATIVKETQP